MNDKPADKFTSRVNKRNPTIKQVYVLIFLLVVVEPQARARAKINKDAFDEDGRTYALFLGHY